MTAPKNNKRGRAALVVVLCLLALDRKSVV